MAGLASGPPKRALLNLIAIKEEILRGIRHNYVADALRMTFYSRFVNCYLRFKKLANLREFLGRAIR
jgi:hypothetical protein